MVTATVTEKGYCLDGSGRLDFDHPAILRDLADPASPTSLIGWLVHGLAARRALALPGLTILSCDNLAANGERLGGAVSDLADRLDPDLARWIADEVRFPSSMVDSITPASDDYLSEQVETRTGLYDAWPIQREPFTQWVIAGDFVGERPPLDMAGVQFVSSVRAFEDAKLLLLNGAHSSLAYLGILLGCETVADAMRDPHIARFVQRLMREDIAPAVGPVAGLDVATYIGDILERFENPAIRHLLFQIAWDGSQKLPFRLVPTIEDAVRAGRPLDRLAVPIAAWMKFLALPRPPVPELVDPFAGLLAGLIRDRGPDGVLLESGVFSVTLTTSMAFRQAVHKAWAAMTGPDGVRDYL